jgi:hypothetical protein
MLCECIFLHYILAHMDMHVMQGVAKDVKDVIYLADQ